jgi:glyoxylase-like metal-dependent hydrolase (beta-lactamase superfamily II)
VLCLRGNHEDWLLRTQQDYSRHSWLLGIETPGHTSGHVSYFYRPERALFAGDALAVIDRQIRFMARPVTLDTASARRSIEKCLRLRPHLVCPGHREPLVAADGPCESVLQHLAAGGRWPLLG